MWIFYFKSSVKTLTSKHREWDSRESLSANIRLQNQIVWHLANLPKLLAIWCPQVFKHSYVRLDLLSISYRTSHNDDPDNPMVEVFPVHKISDAMDGWLLDSYVEKYSMDKHLQVSPKVEQIHGQLVLLLSFKGKVDFIPDKSKVDTVLW